MSVYVRNLAAGNLTTNATTSPGPTPGKSWLVKGIFLTNRDTTPRSVEVRIANGAALPSAPQALASIAPPNMVISGLSTVVIDSEITLQYPTGAVATSQEKININAVGTGTISIDVVICGLERDI